MTEMVIGRRCIDAATVLGDLPADLLPVITHAGARSIADTVAADATAAGVRSEVMEVPDGEAAKSFGVLEEIVHWLASLGVRRDGVVVAVGGGSVTDVAGFAAAVYLRGIDVILVPTTLLGAVDASIGGKTGVNVSGKNLAGSFRLPRRVVIDVDVLDSLPEHLRRHGLAEALKAGMIGDPELVALLERGGAGVDLEPVVGRAIDVKVGIVGRDPFEVGERAHLNYGHTVGHAIESALGMAHGDAVAVGMVAAGRVSSLVTGFGEEERQRAIIESLGLPVAAPGADRQDVRRYLHLDKKHDRLGLRMVVLEGVGRPSVVHVDDATVEVALDAAGVAGEDR